MEDIPDIPPGSQDDLLAENEVLKLKLELEHGMLSAGTVLSPEVENKWLKSIYDFEVMLKAAKDMTVYDIIGQPCVKPWQTLKINEVGAELRRMLGLLENNGITLFKLEACDDVGFYKIITEELLPMKISDIGKGPLFSPAGPWFGMEQ